MEKAAASLPLLGLLLPTASVAYRLPLPPPNAEAVVDEEGVVQKGSALAAQNGRAYRDVDDDDDVNPSSLCCCCCCCCGAAREVTSVSYAGEASVMGAGRTLDAGAEPQARADAYPSGRKLGPSVVISPRELGAAAVAEMRCCQSGIVNATWVCSCCCCCRSLAYLPPPPTLRGGRPVVAAHPGRIQNCCVPLGGAPPI